MPRVEGDGLDDFLFLTRGLESPEVRSKIKSSKSTFSQEGTGKFGKLMGLMDLVKLNPNINHEKTGLRENCWIWVNEAIVRDLTGSIGKFFSSDGSQAESRGRVNFIYELDVESGADIKRTLLLQIDSKRVTFIPSEDGITCECLLEQEEKGIWTEKGKLSGEGLDNTIWLTNAVLDTLGSLGRSGSS